MKTRELTLALALLFASTLSPLHARTWTDTQGRTLEADYMRATATDVTLRRSADARTFVLPLATLTTADRDFVSTQIAASPVAKFPASSGTPSAHDFAEFNTLIVGYNRASNEIAVSDSWGPKFQERWSRAPTPDLRIL